MAALDGAIKSLMQGVSQQVPRERLDGQVSVQTNMLSDIVNGMRRRPGARMVSQLLEFTTSSNTSIFSMYVDVGDEVNHVFVNTSTGQLLVMAEDFTTVKRNVTDGYLVAPDASFIQTASLRGDLYIANKAQRPTLKSNPTPGQDPNKTGFFFIRTGAFSKTYDITISSAAGSWTATYTTPDGQTAGDADKAKPEYIAEQLVTAMALLVGSNVGMVRYNSYVYVSSLVATCTVTSNSGSTYAGWSNNSRVSLTTDLPARLPVEGNAMLCAVGTSDKNFVWYKYDHGTSVWLESGDYSSAGGFNYMPIKMSLDGAYTVTHPEYEGRLAGSDTTNENPAFIDNGITGFGAFQGRLVILAGAELCMSASGNPLRWYRSTVTSILVDDPINIFSGAAASTAFQSCVQFNKDLLLFSRSCQAVVPSGNAAITPNTAQIVITSQYSTDVLAQPSVVGRSVLYPIPRTESYAGVLEMVPSNTTDSQYTSNDITVHIPNYLPGRIRSITSSTTANACLLLCTGDSQSIFVQNYLWSGDEKVQSAWHQWVMPLPVVCTWFVRDRVYVGLRNVNSLVIVTIEPQAGDTYNGAIRPFSDLYTGVVVSSGTFILPQWLRDGYNSGLQLLVTYGNKRMWVGIESVNTSTWVVQLVRNVPNGTYLVGFRFDSTLSPTPPLMRDQNGVVIGTSKSMLVRYELTVQDSGAFNIEVEDTSREITDGEFSGLLYSSTDLEPNHALQTQIGRIIVPVRALAQNTVTTFSTTSETDMRILDIEYVTQYRARRKRA